MGVLLNGPQINGTVPAKARPQSSFIGTQEVNASGSVHRPGPPTITQVTLSGHKCNHYVTPSLDTFDCCLWSTAGVGKLLL